MLSTLRIKIPSVTRRRVKQPLPGHLRRAISSAVHPVNLEYDKLVPSNGNQSEAPLVILHGLLYVAL